MAGAPSPTLLPCGPKPAEPVPASMADITKRLEKAEKYLQKGKTDAALEEYLEALQDDPNNESVTQQAADLCVTLNRTSEATSLLGTLFEKQASIGDVAKANITYKKLLRFATPTVDQTYRFARLVEKTARKESLDSYRTAVSGFTGAGRKKDALGALQHLVALEPNIENFKQQGELAAELGDGKTAATAFYQVGELEKKASNDGSTWFARAHELDPHNHAAALEHAKGLLAKGDANAALHILEPIASVPDAGAEFREAYGRALMAAGRPLDAEPYVWELFQKDPKQSDEVVTLIAALIDAGDSAKALGAAHKLEDNMQRQGQRREFVSLMKDVTDSHPPGVEFLEYMVELYNSANREGDYCTTLIKLFELYYAIGNFLKAGDALDMAAEVDPYEAGHHRRLEMLTGKLDANRYNAIANRFAGAKQEETPQQKEVKDEPTVLEDFILQAEIFLQYSMRSKAVERLERVMKLFPREEERNEKLRQLYLSAGIVPKYDDVPQPARPAAAAAAAPAAPGPVPVAAAAPASDDSGVDNIAKVTEISRNIYRQGNVKGVLFAAANDVGRHWNASRCVAGLCSPGKPPSAALEYCAPGVAQSDVVAIVKLIGTLQSLAVARGTVTLSDAQNAPELTAIKQFVVTLGIHSIVAVPLIEGEEHIGLLILEQCAPRSWRATDVMVLKTIADQMVLAVNNARLRSLMKTLAVTDEKSGLLKRSSYIDVLLSESRRAIQQNSTASIMLMSFGRAGALVKEIGEQAVEGMMQNIGQSICSHVRQNDVAIRYELTTIAVVLSDTGGQNSFFVVEKLKKVLAGTKVPGTDRPVPVTVGIAEAVMRPNFDPIDIVTEVINRAETALEAAKSEGPGSAKAIAPDLEAAAVA